MALALEVCQPWCPGGSQDLLASCMLYLKPTFEEGNVPWLKKEDGKSQKDGGNDRKSFIVETSELVLIPGTVSVVIMQLINSIECFTGTIKMTGGGFYVVSFVSCSSCFILKFSGYYVIKLLGV